MDRAWFVGLLWCVVQSSASQNLVPNGSFEEYTACPTADDQMNYATGWDAYLYSPDFWHACGIPFQSGVPNNIGGYQLAHSGQGYAGIHAFTDQGLSGDGYREVFGVHLSTPMVVGQMYDVRFYLSWTSTADGTQLSMQYANNKIGVLFSTYSRTGFGAWYPLPNYAHVFAEAVIIDSVAWTLVEGNFLADSAYSYLYLGNFFGDAETEDTLVNPGGMFGMSYYYVDDVCVTTVGDECNFSDLVDESGEIVVMLGPNPFTQNIWLQGRTGDQLQLAVYMLTGQEVLNRSMLISGEYTPIDLSEVPVGPCLLVLSTNRQEQRRVLLIHE